MKYTRCIDILVILHVSQYWLGYDPKFSGLTKILIFKTFGFVTEEKTYPENQTLLRLLFQKCRGTFLVYFIFKFIKTGRFNLFLTSSSLDIYHWMLHSLLLFWFKLCTSTLIWKTIVKNNIVQTFIKYQFLFDLLIKETHAANKIISDINKFFVIYTFKTMLK